MKFVFLNLKYNIKSAMEYKFSFFLQIAGMFFNDLLLLFFWWVFFSKVTTLNGYGIKDLMLLYTIPVTGFGLAEMFFGNHRSLSRLINEGGLDSYLTLPKDPLLSTLCAKTTIPALGDFLFGVILFFTTQDLSFQSVSMYLAGSLSAAVIWISFSVILSSLAFFFGHIEIFVSQLTNALITFSLYPPGIFEGLTRLVLFTLIPTGFFCYIPVALIRKFDLTLFITLVLTSFFMAVLARGLFTLGLKKYESGNLMTMKV